MILPNFLKKGAALLAWGVGFLLQLTGVTIIIGSLAFSGLMMLNPMLWPAILLGGIGVSIGYGVSVMSKSFCDYIANFCPESDRLRRIRLVPAWRWGGRVEPAADLEMIQIVAPQQRVGPDPRPVIQGIKQALRQRLKTIDWLTTDELRSYQEAMECQQDPAERRRMTDALTVYKVYAEQERCPISAEKYPLLHHPVTVSWPEEKTDRKSVV